MNMNALDAQHDQSLDSIADLIADIRAGKMVILMDGEDRENEGDLIMAAERVRPQDINFMARYGRGLICLTLTTERCRQLCLPQMVDRNEESHRTAFTVSIEAADGVTTGISAHDRAHTVRTAVRKEARPEDLVQPGHIFPLMARPGGVLARAGHTEAGCDLARLAGLEPAAVIVEILNEDGTMARRPDLQHFARGHGIRIGTIADVIRYRLLHEHSVERVAETAVQTEFGEFRFVAYQDAVYNTLHGALVKGTIDPERPPLVRVHLRTTLADVFAIEHTKLAFPVRDALRRIAMEPSGVLLILRKPETPQEIVSQLISLSHLSGDDGPPVATGAHDPHFVLRTHGIGSQILTDLGVRKMRLLMRSVPTRIQAISGFDLEVIDFVPFEQLAPLMN